MGGIGEAVIRSKSRPTVDQDGFDTLNGNRVLVLPKKYGLQEDDVVAGGRRRLATGEAAHTENSSPGTASKHDNDKRETIGSLLWDFELTLMIRYMLKEFMCKGWLFLIFIINIFGQGPIHLAPIMMHNTPMQILSVLFVVLCWTDIKFAFGQTDYGVLADPLAGTTSSTSFMVTITLLATIIIGAVGVAFRVHSRRHNPMKVIDEALKDAPRMVRSNPDLELLPAIEPWSGME